MSRPWQGPEGLCEYRGAHNDGGGGGGFYQTVDMVIEKAGIRIKSEYRWNLEQKI